MAIIEAEDGVRVGPNENDRLPMFRFDEYVFSHELGEMTANEVRTVSFGECATFYGGENLSAKLYNPQSYNGSKLLIQHVWYDTLVSPPELKVMFRNLESSTVDFGNDEVVIGGWNTTAP